MEEFKSYKLSEVANLSTGFPFDGSKYSKSGIRVVRGDNVTIGSLRWDSEKLKCWSEPFSRAKEYSLQDGDIVIGMDGSRVGRNRAQISESDLPLLLAQRVACIRHNEKSVQDYLYYLIFNERFVDYVKSVQTGTSIPHISLKQIGDYEVQLPSIERQKSICRVLKSLDEKIALNNRINHNLEDCLFSLYIRLLENQCGLSTIGQVSERIYSGGTPDTKNSDFWGGAINWLSSGETSERFIIDTEKRITENGVRHSSTKYASKYDVVIASAGQGNTRGQTSMTLLNTCINQSVIVIHANSVEAPAIFCSLANRYDELRAISDASSIRGSLTTKMISALEIPIFPEVESVKFSSQAMCLIDQIENNLRENRSLKEQRDTLLPKLMGGELCK